MSQEVPLWDCRTHNRSCSSGHGRNLHTLSDASQPLCGWEDGICTVKIRKQRPERRRLGQGRNESVGLRSPPRSVTTSFHGALYSLHGALSDLGPWEDSDIDSVSHLQTLGLRQQYWPRATESVGRAGIHPRTACLRAAPPAGEHSPRQIWYGTAEASWHGPGPLGMCGLGQAEGSCNPG